MQALYPPFCDALVFVPSVSNASLRPPTIHSIAACIPHDPPNQPIYLQSSTTRTRPRNPLTLPRCFPLPLVIRCTRQPILIVQIVRLDVLHDGLRDEISDRHVSAAEQADLGAGDVVLDELLDHPDVVFPVLQGGEGFVYVCAGALDHACKYG